MIKLNKTIDLLSSQLDEMKYPIDNLTLRESILKAKELEVLRKSHFIIRKYESHDK